MPDRRYVLTAALFAMLACRATISPTDTTLCAIVANPARFDGKDVRFIADFRSDGVHTSLLVDPSCPDVGIAPFESSSLPTAEKEHFDRAIYSGAAGTLDKHISAVFSGRYQWDAAHPERQSPLITGPRHSIVIAHVERVVLTRRDMSN